MSINPSNASTPGSTSFPATLPVVPDPLRSFIESATNGAAPNSFLQGNGLELFRMGLELGYAYGYQAGSRTRQLEAEGQFLDLQHTILQNEIAQISLISEANWLSHKTALNAKIENIYRKFKALDDEVRELHLSASKKAEELRQTNWRCEAHGEADGTAEGCRRYLLSAGIFFTEVETFYHLLPTLSEKAIEEAKKEIEEEKAKEKSSESPDSQEERALNPASSTAIELAPHQLLKHEREEEWNRLSCLNLRQKEENEKLAAEKERAKEVNVKIAALYNGYIKKYLTPPRKRSPPPLKMIQLWDVLYDYQRPKSVEPPGSYYAGWDKGRLGTPKKIVAKLDEVILLIEELIK